MPVDGKGEEDVVRWEFEASVNYDEARKHATEVELQTKHKGARILLLRLSSLHADAAVLSYQEKKDIRERIRTNAEYEGLPAPFQFHPTTTKTCSKCCAVVYFDPESNTYKTVPSLRVIE